MVNAAAELLARWPLDRDPSEETGHLAPGVISGAVRFDGAGARFDGNSHISITDSAKLDRSTRELTISAHIKLDDPVVATVGDIVARFDPVSRRGFSLGVTHGSSTSSQRNDRNLVFGVDGGTEPLWTREGRPGEALYVNAMATCAGSLYVGTYEGGQDQTGHVYRHAGNGAWSDAGAPITSNGVSALAVIGDALYAGTTRMIGGGSALPDSPNRAPGGEVFRFTEADGWTGCGRLGNADSVGSMAVLAGELFASPAHHEGIYRYRGGTTWEPIGTPGRRLIAMAAYRDSLLGAGNDHVSVEEAMTKTRAGLVVAARSPDGGGGVFRWEGGTNWRSLGMQPDTTQVYSIAVYEGDLHIGTWPNGLVFRYFGEGQWERIGRLGEETEVMGIVAYNGKLYAGTVPRAQVYRYDGGNAWSLTGRLDFTPEARYRRAASMAIHHGRLFCGTLPSGDVWSLRTGAAVSHDRALTPGWHHVVASYANRCATLYLDGRKVGESVAEVELAIGNDQPMRIGGGPQADFTGWIRDLRLYARALSAEEIRLTLPEQSMAAV